MVSSPVPGLQDPAYGTPQRPEVSGNSGPRVAPMWALIACVGAAALFGLIGGFVASGLHPGPKGAVGQTGAPGPAGATGPAGSAAAVADLGVCVDTQYTTQNSLTWVASVNIFSPSKHADGTTYCSSGEYVAVQPQS